MLFQFLIFKMNQETKSSLKTTSFMEEPLDKKREQISREKIDNDPDLLMLF